MVPGSCFRLGGEPGTLGGFMRKLGDTKILLSGQKKSSPSIKCRAGVEESVLISFGEFPGNDSQLCS